jgi:LuxR family maltose regulon positive regulatory protein
LGLLPPRSSEGLVTALINELAADPGPDEVLLVLDDYHLVDSGPVHESVAFLLENLPAGLRVVVSGRADPPLPLARLRARGQLAELRAADLRFTPVEAAALLGEAAGPGLPGAAVAALVARTEGWAAGLQLAGLSLRGHADAAGFAAAFSGSHRFVLDYLADEVLDGQTGQVRAFLLETSVLERLSGELCDAVTGRAGGQAMLAGIERAGLFVVPLDEVRGWWRYHHLFADLLRARLQAEQPGRVQALHRAAAAWSEEHDLADDAVRHALTAGDAAWAARLVERHVEELLGRSEGATLRRWLSALPAESVRDRPRLCLAQAYGAAMGFQLEALEALLDDAERAFAVSGDEPYEPSLGPPQGDSVLANVPAGIAFLRASLARLADALLRGLEPGGHGLAGRPARASRARPGRGARRAAGGRRALRWLSPHARLLRPGRGAARPGQPGCGTGDLPPSAGCGGREQPDSPRGPGARGPGPGPVRAERADCRPGPRHPGGHAVPAACLHPGAGRRPGCRGPDPARAW